MRPYRVVGVGLLRATAVSSAPVDWPDLEDQHGTVAWLRQEWNRETAQAVRLASTGLAERVAAICADGHRDARAIRRAALSMVRYRLRAHARPTPFGVFAGVAPLDVGPLKVGWGERHRGVARVDGDWLDDVIVRLEAWPELLERLPVMASSLSFTRGDRLAVPYAQGRVEVRRTPAVERSEQAAMEPIRFGSLAELLCEDFPGARQAAVRRMLRGLITQGFLITSLRAPSTVTDPLRHLLQQLEDVHAEDLPGVSAMVHRLRSLHSSLARHDECRAPDTQAVARHELIPRMREVSRAGRMPLGVDLRLDADVTIPPAVIREMERAAWALLRLSAHPAGRPTWRDWHARFLERYGYGTLVRVTEAVDLDAGLGFPVGYIGGTISREPLTVSERDDRLLALAQEALLTDGGEVELSEPAIEELSGPITPGLLPPHMEISARILAPSTEHLERGEFRLVVAPARTAGTMTGRFTREDDPLADFFSQLPTIEPDAIPAQLSVRPLYPHGENISRVPRFLPHVISLGEHRPCDEHVIPLSDLAVSADWYRLRLISMSRGRPVEPVTCHALADKQLPPLARFLLNLPQARSRVMTTFDWGAAGRLPRLPRVRYGSAVLAPAQWRLDARELPAGRADAAWRDALERWRTRWSVPRQVECRDDATDRVLRLQLDEPAHCEVLRVHLQEVGHAVLTEAPATDSYGWLGGHAHEVAFPLLLTQHRTPTPRPSAPVRVSNRQGYLPAAGEWLYAKIYLHPARQSEVIAKHMPRLLANMPPNGWWFLRYRSPDEPDHLRFRVRVKAAEGFGRAATALGAWVDALRADGITHRLTFDTYVPELGRYGGTETMAAAEDVFCADSRAVLHQLQHHPGEPVNVAAALNIIDIACAWMGSREDGMGWLIAHPPERPADVSREFVQHLRTADPLTEDRPGWAQRRSALATYRALLPEPEADRVLESLLHLHHIRLAGIDRESEAISYRLARGVVLRSRAGR